MSNEQSITLRESARLAELESTIEKGMTTFVEVGQALAEILNSRLYRSQHKTFEAYCRDKWDMSRPRVYQLMGAAEVTTRMSTTVDMRPNNERQARPLTELSPDQQSAAWSKAVEIADGKQPTAKQVERAVQITRGTPPSRRPRPKKRLRGSYEDWRKLRDICGQIDALCLSLEKLKVDAPHEIQARNLCAKLATKLNKISENQ